jgi:hypothetical protein
VKPKDVVQTADWDCKNITGSRSLHSMALVSHKDVVLLKMQELTYFYSKCMDVILNCVRTRNMWNLGDYIHWNH